MAQEISYSEAKSGLNDASDELVAANRGLDSGIVQINRGSSDLNALAAKYSDLKQNIDHTLSLYPDNTAWKNVKAEMDLLLKDRQTLKGWADQLVTDINNNPKPVA